MNSTLLLTRWRKDRAWLSLLAIVLLAIGLTGTAAVGGPTPGVIRIGIDYVPKLPGPTDYRDYTPESFDLWVAKEIAAKLGLRLELKQIASGEGTDALAKGSLDLILNRSAHEDGVTDGITRIPTGYQSGLSVAMRSDTKIRSWRDLDGKTVCLSEGNQKARALAEQAGAKVRTEKAPARSLLLVRTGECDAAIHDQLLLERLFAEDNWQKFSATLPARQESGLVVDISGNNAELARAVEDSLSSVATHAQWQALEKKWAKNVAFEVYLDQDAPDCH